MLFKIWNMCMDIIINMTVYNSAICLSISLES